MKFLLLLLSFTCLAQKAETTLYIQVAATDTGYPHAGNYYINVDRLKGNKKKESYYTHAVEGSDNLFSVKVPKGKRFKVGVNILYYYYDTDTIIKTGSADSLFVTLKLKPKKYVYTEAKAKEDIQNGIIRFITFDKGYWGTKIDVKKQFGFEYLLVEDPIDWDFRDQIEQYTFTMKQYLFSVDSTWSARYEHVTDSITHYNADSYSRQHTIDIDALKVPKYRKLPREMKKTIAETKEDAKSREIENLSEKTSQVLYWIDNNKEYHHIFEARYWMAFNYESIIPELIKRVTNKKEVGLTNSADLIIWERCAAGDLKFYGHGGSVDDDLFTIAGRANHLLTRITGEYFGSVSMYATETDLKKLQNRWAYWLLQLQEK